MTSTGQDRMGVPKISDKKVTYGERVHANSDITTKKIMYKFLFFTCFWSVRQVVRFLVRGCNDKSD